MGYCHHIFTAVYLLSMISTVIIPYIKFYDKKEWSSFGFNLLVFTNMVILPSNIWCIYNFTKKNFSNVILEFLTGSSLFIFSSLYHICDASSKQCFTNYHVLQNGDFILSFHMITVIVLFISKIRSFIIKLSIYLYSICLLTFITLEYNKFEYQIVVPLSTIIILIIYIIYKRIKYGSDKFKKFINRYDIIDAVVCAFLVIIGCICKFYSDNHIYWLYHSLWHICIMSGIYFGYEITNKSVFLCCFRKKEEEENDDELTIELINV